MADRGTMNMRRSHLLPAKPDVAKPQNRSDVEVSQRRFHANFRYIRDRLCAENLFHIMIIRHFRPRGVYIVRYHSE